MDWDDDVNLIGNSVDFEREKKPTSYSDFDNEEDVWTEDDSSDEAPVLDKDEELLPQHNPFDEKPVDDKKQKKDNEWQKINKKLIHKEIEHERKKMKERKVRAFMGFQISLFFR